MWFPVIAGLILAGEALACACCVERGERFFETTERAGFIQDELEALRAQGPGTVFVTACDLECVEGVRNPQYSYPVDLAIHGDTLMLDLGGGTISLHLPHDMTRFAVDTRPFATDTNVLLWSEVRAKGRITATGDFADLTGAAGEFVLTGQGNACWNLGLAGHWMLDVYGPSAGFRIFGKLAEQ